MSTGQLPLSSPSFLDIARLRTGLSLVLSVLNKTKQTKKKSSFKHQWPETKASFPVKVTDENHETNIKNTTVLALTRCLLEHKIITKTITTDDWKVLSFIWTTGSVFVPFERKENQEETKRWSLDSESGSSYFSMSNPLWARLSERMKDLCCAVCTPRFHIYSECTGAGRMEGTKEGWGKWSENTLDVAKG